MIDQVPGGNRPPAQVLPKSSGLAIVLSFLIPGVGSMYAGKTGKGIGIFAGAAVSVILMLVFIGFITYPVFWIWGLVAAHSDTVAWNWQHGFRSS